MTGTPIDIAMSLGTHSPDVARHIGAKLDVEASEADRRFRDGDREQFVRHLHRYADMCRQDADQRLMRDLADWKPLSDEERRARLSERSSVCEIYAELNRIAADYGPDAAYGHDLDQQLSKRGFSEFQRFKIGDLLEKGYAREAHKPGSLAAFVPPEDLLRKMTPAQNGNLRDATTRAARARQDAETFSAANYRRAALDPDGMAAELEPRQPPRRTFGGSTFPQAPYTSADAIDRAFLPHYSEKWADFPQIGEASDDENRVPRLFHESELPEECFIPSPARRPEATGAPADDAVASPESISPQMPPPSSLATEIVAGLGQFFTEKILPILPALQSRQEAPPPAPTRPDIATTPRSNREGDDRAAVMEPPGTGKVPPPPAAQRVTLTGLFERFATTRKTWDGKTLSQARQTTNLFIQATDVEFTADIRAGHILKFRETLERLPCSYGKSAGDRSITLTDIIERAGEGTWTGLSAKTVNRHFSHLFALLEYACAGELVDLDIEKLRKVVRARKSAVDDDPRVAYTTKDLHTIFSQETWSRADQEVSAHGYWVPLLGYYTAARLGEICHLRIMDVDIEKAMIDITPHESRRLKNRSSKRRVPLHSELIRLGFIDFVASRKGPPEEPLFAELKGTRTNEDLAALFSKDWSNLLPRILPNARAERKSFHSFRHTTNTILGERGVTEDFRNQLLGHAGRSTNSRVYTHAYDDTYLREAVQRLTSITDQLRSRDWKKWRPPPEKPNRSQARPVGGASRPRKRVLKARIPIASAG